MNPAAFLASLTPRAWKLLGIGALVVALGLIVWMHFAGDSKVRNERDKLRVALTEFRQANAAATEWAKAEQRAREAQFKAYAERIEREHASLSQGALAVADRFISANRLRPQSCPGGVVSATPGQDIGPGVPVALPADAVVVSAEDVRACTSATAYAVSAHDWARGLKDQNF